MPDLFSSDECDVQAMARGGTREVGRRVVTFRVVGVPTPQGSMKSFVPKGWNRAVLTSDNPNLRQWRQLVAAAASDVATGELYTGPVRLDLAFHLPKPKSAPRSVVYPTKKPDLDKLVRAVKDALKHVLWEDDSQVVDLVARKRFADVASPVGVLVTVSDEF